MPAKTYPPGVPCWVETLQPDPGTALAFYRTLFGWAGSGTGPMPDGGEYFVARLQGEDVAGIATLPPGGIAEPQWTTYVSVADLEDTVERLLAAGGSVIVAPLDAQPAGRLAIVAAPTGASFGLWEPAARSGAQRINEANAWSMSSLRTPNLQAALPFYTAVFGWYAAPFEFGGAKGALLRLPGYVGGLPEQPVPRDVVAVAFEGEGIDFEHWSVDFWIDDVDAAVECVGRHAGTVIKAPFTAPPFRQAVIADPAGAVCTISQLIRS
jgi:uncharacterized protein